MARADFADDEESAPSRDDVELETADSYVAAVDLEAAFFEQRGNEGFGSSRQAGLIGRLGLGRGRSSFRGSRRRRFRGPLRR